MALLALGRPMRRLRVLGFSLVTLAYLDWARLALAGGLAAFGATLLVEAALLALLAFLAWRTVAPRWLAASALGALALLEAAGLLALGEGGLMLLLTTGAMAAGLAISAWRVAATPEAEALRPGAFVTLAGFLVFLGADLLAGSSFLLLGQLLGAAGWSLVAFAPAAVQPTSEAAHAGARP